MMSVFPFIDNGLELRDVEDLLAESGLGKPSYYEWRSRSGCYFCFYQRKQEWISLSEKHPDLFKNAIHYERKLDHKETASKNPYTWSHGESLTELLNRKHEIKRYEEKKESHLLVDILEADNDDNEDFCAACHL